MLRKTMQKHRKQEILKNANCKIALTKYNFSAEFAEEIYAFSEAHHKDHFKVFNKEMNKWVTEHFNDIEREIENIQKMGFTGTNKDIMDKIKISARFYYRKKTKQAAAKQSKHTKPKEKKPYIGLSKTFIIKIDEYIMNELISKTKFNRKSAFVEFTTKYIEDISLELSELKKKYDEMGEQYEPKHIANKFKKAFENRYYTYFSVVRDVK